MPLNTIGTNVPEAPVRAQQEARTEVQESAL
jgi:hypothetical protein